MPTFSELVDTIILETMRPDRKLTISEDLNASIREAHFRPGVGSGGDSPVRMAANLVEVEVTPTASSYVWPIPRRPQMMQVESVYCPIRDLHFKPMVPGSIGLIANDPDLIAYYYRTGPNLAMAGCLPGRKLAVAYYSYLPTLQYLAPLDRTIRTNPSTGELEVIATGLYPTEAEMTLESNWMLERYASILREGVMAKLWKTLNDLERARLCYSAWQAGRTAIQNVEGGE